MPPPHEPAEEAALHVEDESGEDVEDEDVPDEALAEDAEEGDEEEAEEEAEPVDPVTALRESCARSRASGTSSTRTPVTRTA